MCRFKSGIILKSKAIVAPGADDSHTTLLESLGIEDTLWNAQRVFVRAELAPENNEWWISPREQPEKWSFVVDQDVVPEWFDKTEQETIFREYVCDWWDKHVLVDKQLEKLSAGFYRLRQCVVKRLCNDVLVLLNDSHVDGMHDRSRVGRMYDNSWVGEMHGSSQVGEMCDNSWVGEMHGNSQVDGMHGNSQVSRMYGRSQVGEMCDNSWVGEMHSNSQVSRMYDSSQVDGMHGNSQVSRMYGRSQVDGMYDNSWVGEMHNRSHVNEMYNSSQVGEMYNSSTARDFKRYPHIRIMVPDTGNFEIGTSRGR